MANDVLRGAELRVGLVIEVKRSPDARKPAYRLVVDFGTEIGRKKSSAQITEFYTGQALMAKLVICTVNVEPLTIGSFVSEVVVNGFKRANGVWVLAVPDADAPLGTRLE